MSGDAGRCTGERPIASTRWRDRAGVRGALGQRLAEQRVGVLAEGAVDVLVAPHDALRHPGRPARVDEPQLVAGARLAGRRVVLGEQRLVVEGTVEERRAVVDLHDRPQPGQRVPHRLDRRGERPVEDEHLGVGVLEQVGELGVEVAVVHVHVHGPGLQPAVHRLEELVAVVEVERDLRIGLEPQRAERRGEPGRPVVEVAPRAPGRALHERRPSRAACRSRTRTPSPGSSRPSRPPGRCGSAAYARSPWRLAGADSASRGPPRRAPGARHPGRTSQRRAALHARRRPRRLRHPPGPGPAAGAAVRPPGRRPPADLRGRRRGPPRPHEAARDHAVAPR